VPLVNHSYKSFLNIYNLYVMLIYIINKIYFPWCKLDMLLQRYSGEVVIVYNNKPILQVILCKYFTILVQYTIFAVRDMTWSTYQAFDEHNSIK